MANLQKKRLEDIIKEQSWNIGVGGLKLGNALLGLGFNNKGKVTGNIGTKLAPGVTIGARTDDVGHWFNKLTGKSKKPTDNKSTTSGKIYPKTGYKNIHSKKGYDTSLKPGDTGYKSAARRRQLAALRNQ